MSENHDSGARRLLHVGCGTAGRDRLPSFFHSREWNEIRYDIDPDTRPDVIGTITDIGAIGSETIDAVWSSHNLEHVNSFEVPVALGEFYRVLRPDGFALITVPDLKAVARVIADASLTDAIYVSPAGPIAPLDVVFGHQASLKAGHGFMAHRTGFTATSLGNALISAGFSEVRVHEGTRWDLWAVATMPETDHSIFDQLADLLT
jgi:SAM-dependent methyltransferase